MANHWDMHTAICTLVIFRSFLYILQLLMRFKGETFAKVYFSEFRPGYKIHPSNLTASPLELQKILTMSRTVCRKTAMRQCWDCPKTTAGPNAWVRYYRRGTHSLYSVTAEPDLLLECWLGSMNDSMDSLSSARIRTQSLRPIWGWSWRWMVRLFPSAWSGADPLGHCGERERASGCCRTRKNERGDNFVESPWQSRWLILKNTLFNSALLW